MAEEALALEARRRLYETVRRNPGASARDLQRETGLAWGETAHHLDRLVAAGFLHREHGLGQDHYFAAQVSLADRSLLRLARSAAARRIILALLGRPELSFAELQEATTMSAARVSIHVRRLLAVGVLDSERRERLRYYRIRDRHKVAGLLARYRSSYADRWVDRFVETRAELFPPS